MMKRSHCLALFCLALLALSQDVFAVWKQIDDYHAPRVYQHVKTTNSPYWSKEAEAETNGGSTSGFAESYAHSRVTSVTWTLSPLNGLATKFWMHFPPGVGEVEVVADGEIEAWARAKGPGEGKAAAFGYVEATYWINGGIQPLVLTATTAVATSTVQGLPSFYLNLPIGASGGNAGLNVPITFRNGSGRVPDSQRGRHFDVACPVTSFRTRESSKCTVFTWSMGSTSGAVGAGESNIEGRAKVTYHLLTHATCPQNP